MILYEPKENVQVVFTPNKESDFKKVVESLGYAKKDGQPYKYVNVQKGSYLKLDGAVETLPATKLTAKGKEIYIVDDSIEVKASKHGANKFAATINSFGTNTEITIDKRNFKGKFTSLGDGSVKDSDGVTLSLGGDSTPDSNPQLNMFIYKMRQDNGNLLAPILKKYITTLHFVGKNRKLITGYAHLPTYLKLIKSPFGDFAKSMRKNKGADAGLVLGEGKKEFMTKVVVRGAKGRKLLLQLDSREKLSKLGDDTKTPNPYVLFTTAPIKITSEDVPKFTIKLGKQTIFVSIFMFEAEKYLTDLKGGSNLLKMW